MMDIREKFQERLNRPTMDPAEVDAAIYGSIGALAGGKQVARPVSIFEVWPDPAQPRRQIPSAVRREWAGTPDSTQALFEAWIRLAASERNQMSADLTQEITQRLQAVEFFNDYNGEGKVRRNAAHDLGTEVLGQFAGSPLYEALLEVVHLAADIDRNGLTNPITVVDHGQGRMVIETGERRWLAYHLLYLTRGEETWSKIPARTVERSSVWRQASENNARTGLNAISLARQLALLVMDLHGWEGMKPFGEMVAEGDCDRAYYAQVADGNAFRIPRGAGEMLLSAMGLKHPAQLRQYRDLLRLPDEVWLAADDLGWKEKMIRELVQKSANGRHLVEMAAGEAAKHGYTVTAVTVWEDAPEETAQDDADWEEVNKELDEWLSEPVPPPSTGIPARGSVLNAVTTPPPAPSPLHGEGKNPTPDHTPLMVRLGADAPRRSPEEMQAMERARRSAEVLEKWRAAIRNTDAGLKKIETNALLPGDARKLADEFDRLATRIKAYAMTLRGK